jgi:hypothetical protein
MSITDIFTPSVVISLAISLLLIGLLGLYVSNKLSEQNHKLNSMFDLVSTLANEVSMVRSRSLGVAQSVSIGGGGVGHMHGATDTNTTHLVNMIDVSDESASSDDDDDDDDDDDSDDESTDADSDEGESDADDDDEDSDAERPTITSEILESTMEEIADLDVLTLEENTNETDGILGNSDLIQIGSNVKNLSVVIDYKKASLSKLREIVEQKGLATDTSKLKKPDLLKMLEIY